MSYSDDLLAQARVLAGSGVGRPKQADLRRAISAAYYAFFHYLTDAIAGQSAGNKSALRKRIARSFSHGDLKDTCLSIVKAEQGRWQQPPSRIAGLFALPLAPEIAFAADAFVQLQEARHAADYDLSTRMNRVDSQTAIQQAAQAMAGLRRLRGSPPLDAFLAALAFAKRGDR